MEIKWSFKRKEKAIQNAADEDLTFCLDSALSLKQNHGYMAQIKVQMFILQVQYLKEFLSITASAATWFQHLRFFSSKTCLLKLLRILFIQNIKKCLVVMNFGLFVRTKHMGK